MANGTRTKTKYVREIYNLRSEIALLRSVVISIIGEDREGKYRSGFVKAMLEASKERPKFEFQGSKALLAQLKNI